MPKCRLWAAEIFSKVSGATLSYGRATCHITIWQIISLHIEVHTGYIRKFCALYSQIGKDNVLLGALVYNCGPGVVNKSSILKKSAEATATYLRNTPPTAATKVNTTNNSTNAGKQSLRSYSIANLVIQHWQSVDNAIASVLFVLFFTNFAI